MQEQLEQAMRHVQTAHHAGQGLGDYFKAEKSLRGTAKRTVAENAESRLEGAYQATKKLTLIAKEQQAALTLILQHLLGDND